MRLVLGSFWWLVMWLLVLAGVLSGIILLARFVVAVLVLALGGGWVGWV